MGEMENEKNRGQGSGPISPSARAGKRTKRRLGMVFLLVLLLAHAGYLLLTNLLVSWSDHQAPRDPATGVLLGAEDRWLGPEEAPGAILFVHGFVGAGQNFADMPERLAAQGWRVRVLRLPGHGTSPRAFERTSPDELLEAVVQELSRLRARYGQVDVVAHSMGGALALLASEQVEVDRLVLAAPYFQVTPRRYTVLPAETWARLSTPVIRWVYKGKLFLQVNRPGAKDEILSYAWVPTRGCETLAELGRRAGRPGLLQAITCPVILLHAQGDRAASVEAAREAFLHLPSPEKRLVLLKQSNHHLFYDFERETVMDEILRFLGTPSPDPPTDPA